MRKLRCVNLVMALALLLVLVPSVVSATPPAQEGQTYTVQKGDNLWAIAEQYLGSGTAYMAIVAATNAKHEEDATFARIDNARLIQPGWKLLIPDVMMTPERVGIDGWVAIAYQAPDGSEGKVFYHVDSLQLYLDYVSFKREWASSTTVQLALVVITEHEKWQLFYPEAARPVAESIATGFSGWSEYVLAAEELGCNGGAGSGAVGEPGLVAADLFLRESPKQTITTSTPFGDVEVLPTISDFESALSVQYLSKGQTRKLLLAETGDDGEPQYTLVVIDPSLDRIPGDEVWWWCSVCPPCCG